MIDVRIREGKRLSVFRSYTYPYMHRPNLTVLTRSLVTHILFDGNRAVGVEILMKALRRNGEFCPEIGNFKALRLFIKHEVMPGPLKGPALEDFIREAAVTVSINQSLQNGQGPYIGRLMAD